MIEKRRMNRHSVLHQSTICDSKTDAPSGGRGFKVMTIKVADPDKQFYPILKKYSQGNISACDAACEIQDMNIPGFDDPAHLKLSSGQR